MRLRPSRRAAAALSFALLASTPMSAAVLADDAPSQVTAAELSTNKGTIDLGFAQVFPKSFYQKDYFPWAILVASIIAAGVVSYVTAGAGAPSAATGVSTVASAVGGGGAGSYMAGLSTIGGFFGGNAMLGSAILNGVSMGLGGASATWASLSGLSKVVVMLSLTATALDGVLLVYDPAQKESQYRISLTVPEKATSREINKLARLLRKSNIAVVKAVQQVQSHPCNAVPAGECEETETKQYERRLAVLKDRKARHADLTERILDVARIASESPTSAENRLVLAIMSKNAGNSDLAEQLFNQIPSSAVRYGGYLSYLNAVLSIERGELEKAERLLRQSSRESPYAIEPTILLTNLLTRKNFEQQEAEIAELISRAEKNFDDDEYLTPYSLLALYNRLGTAYLRDHRYAEALKYLAAAEEEIPWTQMYFGQKDIRKMIGIGIARARLGLGDDAGAVAKLAEVFELARDDQEMERLREVFLGAA